jgi:hypothetical protein
MCSCRGCRRRPLLLAAVHPDNADEIPTAVAALATRPRLVEKVRLRCVDADCLMRPQEELKPLTAERTFDELPRECEIPASDKEGDAADVEMGESQDDATAAEGVQDILRAPMKCFVVDLWPCAYGSEFYKHLVTASYGQVLPHSVFIATTSARPGPNLAAFDVKIGGHAILDRVVEHSTAHGK